MLQRYSPVTRGHSLALARARPRSTYGSKGGRFGRGPSVEAEQSSRLLDRGCEGRYRLPLPRRSAANDRQLGIPALRRVRRHAGMRSFGRPKERAFGREGHETPVIETKERVAAMPAETLAAVAEHDRSGPMLRDRVGRAGRAHLVRSASPGAHLCAARPERDRADGLRRDDTARSDRRPREPGGRRTCRTRNDPETREQDGGSPYRRAYASVQGDAPITAYTQISSSTKLPVESPAEEVAVF